MCDALAAYISPMGCPLGRVEVSGLNGETVTAHMRPYTRYTTGVWVQSYCEMNKGKKHTVR